MGQEIRVIPKVRYLLYARAILGELIKATCRSIRHVIPVLSLTIMPNYQLGTFLGQGRCLGWLNVRMVKSFAEFSDNLGLKWGILKL